jgi:hypothetical protein
MLYDSDQDSFTYFWPAELARGLPWISPVSGSMKYPGGGLRIVKLILPVPIQYHHERCIRYGCNAEVTPEYSPSRIAAVLAALATTDESRCKCCLIDRRNVVGGPNGAVH